METARKTGVTAYAIPTDTEVVITRVVSAPRRLVFAAYTEPAHIRRWLLGPEGWSMPVCEIDARTGGTWRYVWRKANGAEMAMSGAVLEVIPGERIVTTERWGPEWPETVNTVAFVESGGFTTITTTIRYPSKEAREAALATGMRNGVEESYARLDDLLGRLA